MMIPMSMSLPRKVPRIKRRASRTLPLGVIRSQFLKLKTLINEKRDDLLNTESYNFDTILDEFDKLHDQVEKPRKQVADAEALLDLTHTLLGSVRSPLLNLFPLCSYAMAKAKTQSIGENLALRFPQSSSPFMALLPCQLC